MAAKRDMAHEGEPSAGTFPAADHPDADDQTKTAAQGATVATAPEPEPTVGAPNNVGTAQAAFSIVLNHSVLRFERGQVFRADGFLRAAIMEANAPVVWDTDQVR
jgi:hypothetical protein